MNPRNARPKRVLVVDDEQPFLFGVRKLLETDELLVDIAAGFDEAVNLLRARKYGAIVTDINLRSGCENKTGLHLAALAKGIHPRAFVVLITGYRPENLVETMGTLEFDSYVEKPIDVGKLREKLYRLLGLRASGDSSGRLTGNVSVSTCVQNTRREEMEEEGGTP